jgi:hypothetical protein
VLALPKIWQLPSRLSGVDEPSLTVVSLPPASTLLASLALVALVALLALPALVALTAFVALVALVAFVALPAVVALSAVFARLTARFGVRLGDQPVDLAPGHARRLLALLRLGAV